MTVFIDFYLAVTDIVQLGNMRSERLFFFLRTKVLS